MKINTLIREKIQQNNSKTARDSKLWELVQSAYAKSKSYRAGDDPEFARALAEFYRISNPPKRASNVIVFRRRDAR
jgi:hypothetical protein